MVGRSDPAKVSVWRERFERFAASKRKTAPFCAAEGVSPASFYAWRRKLGLAKPRANKKPQAFQQVVVSQQVMVHSAPALSVRLPGGVEIEAFGASEPALRVIVSELVRASQKIVAECEVQRC